MDVNVRRNSNEIPKLTSTENRLRDFSYRLCEQLPSESRDHCFTFFNIEGVISLSYRMLITAYLHHFHKVPDCNQLPTKQ